MPPLAPVLICAAVAAAAAPAVAQDRSPREVPLSELLDRLSVAVPAAGDTPPAPPAPSSAAGIPGASGPAAGAATTSPELLRERTRSAYESLQALGAAQEEFQRTVGASPDPLERTSAPGDPGRLLPSIPDVSFFRSPAFQKRFLEDLERITTELHDTAYSVFQQMDDQAGRVGARDLIRPHGPPGPAAPGAPSAEGSDLVQMQELEAIHRAVGLIDAYISTADRMTQAVSSLTAFQRAQTEARLDQATLFLEVVQRVQEVREKMGDVGTDWSLAPAPPPALLRGRSGLVPIRLVAGFVPLSVDEVRLQPGAVGVPSVAVQRDGCTGKDLPLGAACEVVLRFRQEPGADPIPSGFVSIALRSESGIQGIPAYTQRQLVPYSHDAAAPPAALGAAAGADVAALAERIAEVARQSIALYDASRAQIRGVVEDALTEATRASERSAQRNEAFQSSWEADLRAAVSQSDARAAQHAAAYADAFDRLRADAQEVVDQIARWAADGFLRVEDLDSERHDSLQDIGQRQLEMARWILARDTAMSERLDALPSEIRDHVEVSLPPLVEARIAALHQVGAFDGPASAPDPLDAAAGPDPGAAPDAIDHGVAARAGRLGHEQAPDVFASRVILIGLWQTPGAEQPVAIFGYRPPGTRQVVRFEAEVGAPVAEGWVFDSAAFDGGEVVLSHPRDGTLRLR